MKLKKFIVMILGVCLLLTLCSCSEKTPEDNSISSDILGVWVVEGRENIQNTISDTALEKMYPTGMEIEFTSDGKYIFGGIVIDYKILDDTTIEVERDFVERLNYELSSDTLKIYYQGKDHAVIAKRK